MQEGVRQHVRQYVHSIAHICKGGTPEEADPFEGSGSISW